MYIKYIVIAIMLLGLLFVVEQFRPADAFYMTFLNFTWDGPPLVCIWDSDYNQHAIVAVNAWQDSLYDNFGEGYVFLGTIIKPDTSWEVINQCRIHIVYVEAEHAAYEDLKNERQGLMLSNPSHLNYVFVYIYEGRANIYSDLASFDRAMIRTTMHELGHAFGLGHVVTENMGERIKPWPETLMWAISDPDQIAKIDIVTLEAFRHLYHERSWMGNFAIPNHKLIVTFPSVG